MHSAMGRYDSPVRTLKIAKCATNRKIMQLECRIERRDSDHNSGISEVHSRTGLQLLLARDTSRHSDKSHIYKISITILTVMARVFFCSAVG